MEPWLLDISNDMRFIKIRFYKTQATQSQSLFLYLDLY